MGDGQRVVVTGLGAVSPFGPGLGTLWEGVRNGRSAISPITSFDVSEMPVQYAGEVRKFDGSRPLIRSVAMKEEKCVHMALVAAAECLGSAVA